MNCKTNTIIVIECQLFQYPLPLVLLRIVLFLPAILIPTLAQPQTTSPSQIVSSGLCGFQAPLGTLVGGGPAAVNTRAVSM